MQSLNSGILQPNKVNGLDVHDYIGLHTENDSGVFGDAEGQDPILTAEAHFQDGGDTSIES